MPQIGTHIVIAERTAAALGDAALQQNLPAMRLGGIGPDLMLFLFDPTRRWPVFDTVIDLLLTIREIEQLITDIEARATGPAEDFANWVSGGLSTQVSSLIAGALGALQAAFTMQLLPVTTAQLANPFAGENIPGVPNQPTITVSASPLAQVFRAFGHPYTNDPPFKEPAPENNDYSGWWWIDILHYRRTGAFADHLLRQAGSNPLLRAYATGYASHVAGDVCGHPYVNTVVGGPFRNHVIRHMTVEKVIDAWVWDHFKGGDITRSALHQQVDVGPRFREIAELLLGAMRAVYTQHPILPLRPAHFAGSAPAEADLARAYRTLLQYLDLSTDGRAAAPVAPPGSPAEFFAEIGDSLAGTASNIAESFNPNNEWWEWLLAPFIAALYGLLLLFKLVTLPPAVLMRAFALAPRWAGYLMETALHQYVVNARWTLAISGWGIPSSADLARPFAQLCVRLPPSRTGRGAFDYPYRQPARSTPAFWLLDPRELGAQLEFGRSAAGGVESGPYPAAATPDVFIDGPGYDQPRDGLLQRFAEPLDPQGSLSPTTTRTVEQESFRGPQLGNAVDFTARLVSGRYPLASFDLDGDPGYGFLGWEGPPPGYDPNL